jgi:hypothetical protein
VTSGFSDLFTFAALDAISRCGAKLTIETIETPDAPEPFAGYFPGRTIGIIAARLAYPSRSLFWIDIDQFVSAFDCFGARRFPSTN